MSVFMCPHCGWTYQPDGDGWSLVPTHDFPKPARAVCPGSQQTPRNAQTDRRPLWKDEKAE